MVTKWDFSFLNFQILAWFMRTWQKMDELMAEVQLNFQKQTMENQMLFCGTVTKEEKHQKQFKISEINMHNLLQLERSNIYIK